MIVDAGILLSICALLLWGFSDLVTKMALDRVPLWKVLVISQVFGGSIVFLLLDTSTFNLPGIEWVVYLFLLGVLNYLGMVAFYRALHSKGVALTVPIMHSWAIITVVLSVLLFGERLDILQSSAIVLILVGIAIVTMQRGSWSLDSSYFPALFSMIVFGVYFLLLKIPNLVLGAVLVTGIVKIITGLVSVPQAIRTRALSSKSSLLQYVLILLVGILDGGGFLLYNFAVHQTSLSVASAIVALVPVVGVALGVLVLKERVQSYKLAGMVFAFAGIVLISL